MIIRTKLFENNRTQAVRLPKDVAFPSDVREVEVISIGEARVIVPVGKRWTDYFNNGPRLSDDFSVGPRNPPTEDRESL